MSSFDYSQFEKYVNNFEKMTDEFELFLKQFMLQMAQRVISRVKPRTPVDTGALRASWGIGNQSIALRSVGDTDLLEFDPENSTVADISAVGNNFEVTIWNGMEYASYVEYGHSTQSGAWKNGYFMLTISVDEIEKQMPSRFKSEFIKFCKNKGVG